MSLLYCINSKGNDSIYDQEIYCYSGQSFISEHLDDLEFKISSICLLSELIDSETRDVVLRIKLDNISEDQSIGLLIPNISDANNP